MLGKFIESQNIVLRPYKKGDIAVWQTWNMDPMVQKYMPEPQNIPASAKEQLAYFEKCKKEESDIYWSVVWKENQKLVGSISLHGIDTHHGLAELGIVLGEKGYWGRGIAREAIKLVLDGALRDLRLRRITAEYEEGNIGIEKALQRSGFALEVVAKESRIKQGSPINTVRYVIFLK